MPARRHRGRNSAQDRTRELARDIQDAVRKESWGRNALQLAWTAGPVTYLALQGGYLLGYGETAPPAVFVYFGVYTVIAGVVAILLRLMYRATKGRDVERGTRVIRDCLDQLPRLLLAARDTALGSYTEADAQLLAAKHLLANPDASEHAVAAAIRDLGGSRDLADAFQRIEVFRRNGLPSRVETERHRVEAEVSRLREQSRERSPDTATLLDNRSRGCTPSKRRGRQRTEGFIERALAAENEENERLMSIGDVEEILTFAIELLAGRKLSLITFEFAGNRKVGEAWTALERARREFRSRLRSRNSRLRVLAELLTERVENVLPSIARIRDLRELRDDVVSAMDEWARDLERPRLKRLDRSQIDAFRRAVQAYRYLEQAGESLHRAHGRLVSAAENYRSVLAGHSGTDGQPVAFAADGGRGLRISESELGLDEDASIALARSIQSILDEAGIWKQETVRLVESDMLGVAIEVLSAVEDHIPLYRTEVQQAIELSRAPTIESLEPGLSADVRAGWAIALVDEVEANQAEYALRRLEQLVRFHGLRLGPTMRSRICGRFGIAEDVLMEMAQSIDTTVSPWARTPMSVPRKAAEFRAILDRLNR
ncbi:MAG: hypothetical protein ACOC2Q_02610 [Spirochaetota bacterium]